MAGGLLLWLVRCEFRWGGLPQVSPAGNDWNLASKEGVVRCCESLAFGAQPGRHGYCCCGPLRMDDATWIARHGSTLREGQTWVSQIHGKCSLIPASPACLSRSASWDLHWQVLQQKAFHSSSLTTLFPCSRTPSAPAALPAGSPAPACPAGSSPGWFESLVFALADALLSRQCRTAPGPPGASAHCLHSGSSAAPTTATTLAFAATCALATAWLATSSAAERFARQPSVALLYLPYTHVPYWSVSPHSHPGRDCTPHPC
mmetsp:Transcript_32120/g.75721  ORF Transcript_32120/g.75721 Transcript_32120/m.75721 type:complete len:260 (+) Transcript_32120:582-1361(+)